MLFFLVITYYFRHKIPYRKLKKTAYLQQTDSNFSPYKLLMGTSQDKHDLGL